MDIIREAYEFLSKGGIIMIPILLCSVVGIILFVEREVSLRKKNILPDIFVENFKEAIKSRQWERAYQLCDNDRSVIAQLARTALQHARNDRAIIQEAIEEEAKRQVSRLERFTTVMGAIASISPLLGLLGTVTGMIQIFSRVASEFSQTQQMDAGMLAGGIWEALLTTAAGLSVAIPIFLLHHVVLNKIDRMVLALEKESAEFLDILAPPQEINADAPSAEPDYREETEDGQCPSTEMPVVKKRSKSSSDERKGGSKSKSANKSASEKGQP